MKIRVRDRSDFTLRLVKLKPIGGGSRLVAVHPVEELEDKKEDTLGQLPYTHRSLYGEAFTLYDYRDDELLDDVTAQRRRATLDRIRRQSAQSIN